MYTIQFIIDLSQVIVIFYSFWYAKVYYIRIISGKPTSATKAGRGVIAAGYIKVIIAANNLRLLNYPGNEILYVS